MAKDCNCLKVGSANVASSIGETIRSKNMLKVKVNGETVRALLDTACSHPVMVAEKFVYPKDMLEETVEVVNFAGGKHVCKMVHVHVKSPCVNGRVKAVCVPKVVFEVILD